MGIVQKKKKKNVFEIYTSNWKLNSTCFSFPWKDKHGTIENGDFDIALISKTDIYWNKLFDCLHTTLFS